ncbi:MAG: hypothetical protein ACXADY_23740 [Candidatus Hodarchaeales archaeon]|jgi:hypothetical protein
MSPVCRKCKNYVMKFPCSHCGSEESFADRKIDDFKPIVPVELQGDFEEPPKFISDPSLTPTPSSTGSNTKPVFKPPVPKESSDAPPPPLKVPSIKSEVKPEILEGPPQVSSSSKGSAMKAAIGISRVVDGMATKTEETGYRTSIKRRLLDIENTIQEIHVDIQSLIAGQQHIESMLKEKEEEEQEKGKKKGKKGRFRK